MSFIKNLRWRYATKKFDGRKIPEGDLKKILDAVRMAPTSFGIQPFRISVVEDEKLKKALEPHAWNQKQITTCSHLLVFSSDLDVKQRTDDYLSLADKVGRKDITQDRDYDYAENVKQYAEKAGEEWPTKQAYIALGFAMAACAELEVDSCPLEGFDSAAFKKVLELPGNLDPKVLLAIGYRSSEDKHSDHTKIRFGEKETFDFR